MTKPKPKPENTERNRVDLINFIINATADKNLAKRFLDCKTALQIQKFFKKEGYNDIPLNDCEDILLASQKMHGHGVSDDGRPVYTTTKSGY